MKSSKNRLIFRKKNHIASVFAAVLTTLGKFFNSNPPVKYSRFADTKETTCTDIVASKAGLIQSPAGVYGLTIRRGFTFIEILLVVILLGVLVTVSIPNFQSSFKTLLLKDTANDMAVLMHYAQSRAIVQKIPIEFIYDSGSGTFGLYQTSQTPGGLENGQESTRISGRRGEEYKIPTQIVCETTAHTITFSPDGRISPGRFYLCLQDKCLTVSTQDQSGRVLLLEGTLK